ncbi:GlxA family transcriptional regulator [Roseibacterium sp. SDUM158017]|uniref:GlxA family transcriptional regulator n=1 Tax=Roseicyclus salinarum TaxID=3036773 RepID=UPI002414FE6A|nr:GlxA family transcriptional regulator [Roseibacterium sp. SDUM158017]MDG4647908.1 GlxA family transcriptional regulator [Roseibacterium sp. SDUM158017]
MSFNTHIPPKCRQIAFFAFDGVQSLDVTGPMEAFAVANRFGGDYDLVLASEAGQGIRTHAGIQLSPTLPIGEIDGPLDTLVICGGSEEAMLSAWRDGTTLGALRKVAGRARRIVSICTGAFALAATGLLDGRRAATHWNSADRFRALFPQVDLDADAIYVADPPFFTSAGVTAGIDLSLALIEADHGPGVARAVARELVLFLRRPGGQAQFGAGIDLPSSGPEPILRLAARILEDPAGEIHAEGRQVPDLAALVNMSERSFLRAFAKTVGTTPAKFVEEARLTRAKTLLEETGHSLEQVSHAAGYGSVDALLRSFQKRVGITPGAYRARFARAERSGTELEEVS